MDGNRVHTSIVIELGNQDDAEYQKAYQFEFGDLDIPRDYVIDQIFCGENVTIYAVFEITEEPRKPEKSLDEPNFDVHGDYRIYRETSSRKLIADDSICKFTSEVRSEEDMQLPTSESAGVIYHFRPEENHQEKRKGFDSTVVLVPEKISLGTNTSMAKFTPLFYDKKAIQDNIEVKTVNIDRENETAQKPQPKEKNKNAILKEIKKLQKKINSLIKTIESNDFELDAEDLEICGTDKTNYEEVPKNLEIGVVLKERKNIEYEDMPVLSPLTYESTKQKRTGAVKIQDRWEIPLMLNRSISLLSVGTSTTQVISGREKSEPVPRRVSSDCSINWQGLENWRGAGLSKSEMINHVVLLEPKYNVMKGAKKSLSLELRDDKLEVICCKKIKNFPFKVEGSLKSKGNMRILPKREPSLRDSLPLLNCEMGDEANKKTKTSKVDLMDLVQVRDKQNAISFEKMNLTPNKNLNEEEGDAKLVYSKRKSASSRFPRNNTELEVHFCSTTDNTAPEGLLKNEKNFHTNKLKFKSVDNNVDPALKVCSDSEKPTTPNRNTRKLSIFSEGKKEAKLVTKSYKKKAMEKSEKTEGKDMPPHEPLRPKSVTGNRKSYVRGYLEAKTHADRPVKPELVSNQKSSYLGNRCPEEKAGNKSDRLRRPVSQKRETADPPNDCAESKESKPPKKNCLMVNLSHKKSTTALTNEKAEGVPVVESDRGKPSDKKKRQTSVEPPSVVVELFSEKPRPEVVVLREVDEKSCSRERSAELEAAPAVGENNSQQANDDEDSDELKKPILKSLWALTKLILFEDGTQKLEILEASLNPPEWV